MNAKKYFFLGLLSVVWVAVAGQVPRISIITYINESDEHVDGFLYDVSKQTVFAQSELIIIAVSPSEYVDGLVSSYMARHAHIVYKKVEAGTNLFAGFNMALKMARAPYVTIAMVEDRFKYDCYSVHADYLDAHPAVDCVYSDFLITHYSNELFLINRHEKAVTMPEFSAEHMRLLASNKHMMWRATLHEQYGLFNEEYNYYVGGKDLLLKAVAGGAQLLKVPGIYALYYYALESFGTTHKALMQQQELQMYWRYKALFS